jgi:glycosyltransferase involved in cell wall biosynthesis
VVVEIGTCYGGTLYLWCQAADPTATIISIDLPSGESGNGHVDARAELYRMFAQKGQALHLLRADSQATSTFEKVQQLVGFRPVDFLFINDGHTDQGLKKDFLLYRPLVAPDGCIALHDSAVRPELPRIEVGRFGQELKAQEPAGFETGPWQREEIEEVLDPSLGGGPTGLMQSRAGRGFMRVLALTFGDQHQGSSQYRVYQFIKPLRGRGIDLTASPAFTFSAWDSVPDYDAILVQKKLVRSGVVHGLRRRARRLIYDVDDAIWEPHGKRHFWLTTWRTWWRLRAVAQAADVCVAANSILARELAKWSRRVVVLPMALDARPWTARATGTPGRRGSVRVGWAGHPVNLNYLERIEPALLALQKQRPEVEYVVFCGRPPRFHALKYQFVEFRPGAEPEVIRGFDVGLLPLPDNPFAAGKSPIKALQYMACGIPCVASPVGATCEIFGQPPAALFARTNDEWVTCLRTLLDSGVRGDLGIRARQTFEQNNALSRVAARFSELLHTLQ